MAEFAGSHIQITLPLLQRQSKQPNEELRDAVAGLGWLVQLMRNTTAAERTVMIESARSGVVDRRLGLSGVAHWTAANAPGESGNADVVAGQSYELCGLIRTNAQWRRARWHGSLTPCAPPLTEEDRRSTDQGMQRGEVSSQGCPGCASVPSCAHGTYPSNPLGRAHWLRIASEKASSKGPV